MSKSALKNIISAKAYNAINGPVLHEYKYVDRIQQYANVFRFSVPNGTRFPAMFGQFVTIDNQNNVAISWVTLVQVDEFLERCSLVDGISLDPLLCGANASQCRKIVPKGTAVPVAPAGFTYWQAGVEYFDDWHDELVTVKYNKDHALELCEVKEESEYGLKYIECRTLVDKSTGLSCEVAVAGVNQEIAYIDLDCRKRVKVTRTLCEVAGVTLHRTINYTFPAYVKAVAIQSTFFPDAATPRTVFGVNIDVRDGFTAAVPAEVRISFHAAAPAVPAVTVLQPSGASYNGVLFSFNVQNVLMDSFHLTGNTHSEDEHWGFVIETTPTYNASSPSASAYLDMIGELRLVSYDISPWKFGLWKKEEIWLKML